MNHSITKEIVLHTHHWFMHSMKRLYTPITKLCLLLAIQISQVGWSSLDCFSIEDIVSTSTCMMMEISSNPSLISALSEEIVHTHHLLANLTQEAQTCSNAPQSSEYGTCTYKWINIRLHMCIYINTIYGISSRYREAFKFVDRLCGSHRFGQRKQIRLPGFKGQLSQKANNFV